MSRERWQALTACYQALARLLDDPDAALDGDIARHQALAAALVSELGSAPPVAASEAVAYAQAAAQARQAHHDLGQALGRRRAALLETLGSASTARNALAAYQAPPPPGRARFVDRRG